MSRVTAARRAAGSNRFFRADPSAPRCPTSPRPTASSVADSHPPATSAGAPPILRNLGAGPYILSRLVVQKSVLAVRIHLAPPASPQFSGFSCSLPEKRAGRLDQAGGQRRLESRPAAADRRCGLGRRRRSIDAMQQPVAFEPKWTWANREAINCWSRSPFPRVQPGPVAAGDRARVGPHRVADRAEIALRFISLGDKLRERPVTAAANASVGLGAVNP
jgi:hypothetical protein